MEFTKKHYELSLIRHKLEIAISVSDVSAYITKAINEIRDKSDIPGFRRGKATESGVIAARGEKRVREHAAKLLCNVAFEEAIKGMEKQPVTPPEFDHPELPEKGKPFEFSATYFIEPPDPKTLAKSIAGVGAPEFINPGDVLPQLPPMVRSFGANPISPEVLKKVPGLNLSGSIIPDPTPKANMPHEEFTSAFAPPTIEIPDPEKLAEPLQVYPEIPNDFKKEEAEEEAPEATSKE